MINSQILDGLKAHENSLVETIKILEEKRLGKKQINYRLKDWGVSRQRYWGCPIPIIYRQDGEILAVEDSELPIRLPNDIKLKSSGNPLENHPHWKKTKCPKTGMDAIRETDTLDTFVDSSWYYIRFLNNKIDKPFDKDQVY